MLDRNTYSGSMRCSCGVVDGLRHLFFFLSLLRPNKKNVFVIIAGVVLLVQEAGSGFLVHTLCTLLFVSRPSPPPHTHTGKVGIRLDVDIDEGTSTWIQ